MLIHLIDLMVNLLECGFRVDKVESIGGEAFTIGLILIISVGDGIAEDDLDICFWVFSFEHLPDKDGAVLVL